MYYLALIVYRLSWAMVFCALFIYFCATTSLGLHLAWFAAQKVLPGTVTIGSVQGDLFSTITFNNVRVQQEDEINVIKQIQLNWDATALRQSRLHITSLVVNDVNIQLLPNDKPSTFTLNTVPDIIKKLHFVQLDLARINNVNVTEGADKSLIQFHHIELKQQANQRYQLDLLSNYGTVQGQFSAEKLNLMAKMQVPSPAAWIKTARGQGQVQLTVNGSFIAPNVDGVITFDKLHYQTYEVKHAAVQLNTDAKAKVHGKVDLAGLDVNGTKFQQAQMNFSAERKDSDVAVLADVILNRNHRAKVRANLPQLFLVDFSKQTVTAEITLPTQPLTGLLTIPNISNLGGVVDAKANVSGLLQKPAINLEAVLRNGQFSLPIYGMTMKQINVTAQGGLDTPLTWRGTFNVGAGSGELSGALKWQQKQTEINLRVTGTNLALVKTKEYDIVASPSINLSNETGAWQLQGSVQVPKATLLLQNRSGVVSLPSEVVFVDQPRPEEAKLFDQIGMQLEIQLGDAIYLSDKHLQANLAGKITLHRIPGGILTAVGELHTLKGEYSAYGKQLQIQNGRLVYAGNPISNPGLDIRATKQLQTVGFSGGSQFYGNESLKSAYTGTNTITVGVAVSGTLNQPRATLFSDAGLNQADILSYLMFGYPSGNIGTGSGLAVLNALAADRGTGNLPIFDLKDKFQSALGLSEFTVSNTDYFNPLTNSATSAQAVSIGKQIGKKWFIHYSIGIFDPVQVFNVRYQFNKHFAVQSETSSIDTGADVLYEIEKD